MSDIPPKKYYDKDHGYLLTASQALSNCRVRMIPLGNEWVVSEVMTCDRPKFNGGGYGLLDPAPHRRRSDDDEPLTPDELKEYINRSRRRAYKRVRDIMDCNDFQWFMTFTLDESQVDRTDYAAFIKAINRYFDNRVRRYGWKYCAVVEYHKRTESNGKHALHLHACVSGDKMKLSDSGTVIAPGRKRPITRAYAHRLGFSDDELKTVYNVDDWTLGFSTAIHTYGERLQLSRYITKYITKSDDKIGGRWYYSGGKLAAPMYLYDNIDFDSFMGDIEFSHDFGDFKIKYFDEGLSLDRLDDICKK